jgi:uncharacterized protein (DUF1778 family)
MNATKPAVKKPKLNPAPPGLHIRVTAEELDLIRADAKREGRTVSGYIRYKLLYHHPV